MEKLHKLENQDEVYCCSASCKQSFIDNSDKEWNQFIAEDFWQACITCKNIIFDLTVFLTVER